MISPRMLLAGASLLLTLAGPVAAQPPGGMPDLRAMSGRALPVADLASGTVTIRVARKIPANAVAGVEVTAIVTNAGGDSRKQVVKTGEDGRATFQGLAPGARFEAQVTVDGEPLATQNFGVPAQGGVRVMLIAGLGAGESGAAAPGAGEAGAAPAAGQPGAAQGGEAPAGEPGAAEDPFAGVAMTGTVALEPGAPAGTLKVSVVTADGKPVADTEVIVGQVGRDQQIKAHRARTAPDGVARFEKLPTGEEAGYVAVTDHGQTKLGTRPFRMPTDAGLRAELRPLGSTEDPAVLRLDPRSKIIFQPGEDALQVMQSLVFKNTSDKIFDAGSRGLFLPLPEGHVSAQAIEGGAEIEPRPGDGVVVRAVVQPNATAEFATQARFGFVMKTTSGKIELEQAMPLGMESPLILVPGAAKLTIEAAGLRPLPDDKDQQGNVIKMYELPAIQPGGKLAVTISGLPHRNYLGRTLIGLLCLALVVVAIIASRRPAEIRKQEASAEALRARREKLFAELVDVERRRRDAGAPDPRLDERRRELVAQLELVYRELAQTAHGNDATP